MGKKTRQQSKIQSRSSIYLDISFITGYAEHNDVESWSKTVSFGHVSKGVWRSYKINANTSNLI